MNYSVLGLNGGGMRGALQVGALQVISEKYNEKYLHNIFTDGIYGISIGAIIGTMIAFEFSIDDFELLTQKLSNIEQTFKPLRLQTIVDFAETKGLDDGQQIYELMKETFETKGLKFEDLKIGDASVPLHIIASDLTNLQVIVFGKSIRLWDALRASFSLPVVFTPHTVDDRLCVDGAILCENIMNVVPAHLRAQTLLLLCTRTPKADIKDYLFIISNCRSLKQVKKIQVKYPHNACCLIEDNTQLFTFWNTAELITYLIEVGRARATHFFDSLPSAEIMN